MPARVCAACGEKKAKRHYSYNQWQKDAPASKCKVCVEHAQNPAAAHAPALPTPGAGPAELTAAEVGWCDELDAALDDEVDRDDRERRAEEAETLVEIYPGFVCEKSSNSNSNSNTEEWLIPIQEQHPFAAHLRLLVPSTYPSRSPPTAIIDVPWIEDTQAAEYAEELAGLAAENPGCEVAFLYVEHLKERLEQVTAIYQAVMVADEAEKAELIAAAGAAATATAGVPDVGGAMGGGGDGGGGGGDAAGGGGGSSEGDGREGSVWIPDEAAAAADADADAGGGGGGGGGGGDWVFQPANSHFKQPNRKFETGAFDGGNAVEIIHGETFVDRKSKFEAHLAAVTTGAQVNWVYRTLLQDKRIARASHNVVSWRYFDAEKQVHCSDNDDDGEAGAGNRLAEMMHLMGANGVFVMVSRYYGGVHLGPDRFKHFNNCARELLDAGGFRKEKQGKKKKK